MAHGVGLCLSKLGLIALREGDAEVAVAQWSESLDHFYAIGEQPRVARGIEQVAYAASALELPERAAQLLGAAEMLRDSLGIPL
jgi:hypothetical protein